MATTISQLPSEPKILPTKRQRKPTRKALTQKTRSTSEANILAAKISDPSPISPSESQNENHESLSQPRSAKKATKKVTKQAKVSSFEKDLEEMQEKLEQLKLEKERTDVMLKEKDEMLRIKEEELEIQGKEQQMLQVELKKLQKSKEFRPNMTFPIVQSLRDKELDKKDKKKKKKCCPEKKRPSPPYFLWCKDQWNEIKKDNVKGDFKEMSIILGAKWKNISAEEKKPYEEKYHAKREAYLQIVGKEKREIEAITLLEEEQKQKSAMELLEQYLQFKEETEKDNKKKSKKEKDPLKPKHPMSAFFVFSSERRPAWVAENKSFVEISKIAGEEWKSMTDKQKKPYEETAKNNKEKYQQEMEIYKQNKDEEALNLKIEENEKMKIHKQEALQLLKKKDKTDNIIKKMKVNRQKKRKQNDPNKPKKPASSFLLFSKETRKSLQEERQGINNSTLTALISVQWKELSEQDKQIWNEKAAVAMEAYKKDMEEYNKSAAAIDADKSQN